MGAPRIYRLFLRYMIKCSLDEAAWFDILSIHEVKIENSKDPELLAKNIDNFDNLKNEISGHIGRELFNSILLSEEYKNLVMTNSFIFEMVDDVKRIDNPFAARMDGLNYERYLNKKSLTDKFFGGNIKEVKLGYDKK